MALPPTRIQKPSMWPQIPKKRRRISLTAAELEFWRTKAKKKKIIIPKRKPKLAPYPYD